VKTPPPQEPEELQLWDKWRLGPPEQLRLDGSVEQLADQIVLQPAEDEPAAEAPNPDQTEFKLKRMRSPWWSSARLPDAPGFGSREQTELNYTIDASDLAEAKALVVAEMPELGRLLSTWDGQPREWTISAIRFWVAVAKFLRTPVYVRGGLHDLDEDGEIDPHAGGNGLGQLLAAGHRSRPFSARHARRSLLRRSEWWLRDHRTRVLKEGEIKIDQRTGQVWKNRPGAAPVEWQIRGGLMLPAWVYRKLDGDAVVNSIVRLLYAVCSRGRSRLRHILQTWKAPACRHAKRLEKRQRGGYPARIAWSRREHDMARDLGQCKVCEGTGTYSRWRDGDVKREPCRTCHRTGRYSIDLKKRPRTVPLVVHLYHVIASAPFGTLDPGKPGLRPTRAARSSGAALRQRLPGAHDGAARPQDRPPSSDGYRGGASADAVSIPSPGGRKRPSDASTAPPTTDSPDVYAARKSRVRELLDSLIRPRKRTSE
jgi:hypothetical protein